MLCCDDDDSGAESEDVNPEDGARCGRADENEVDEEDEVVL